MSTQHTGIQLNAKQAIWFILTTIVFPLQLEIDGGMTKGQWATQFIPLAAGSHRISLSWKLYWVLPVNRATLDVTLAEGQVVSLTYKMRWLFFLPGKLLVDTAPAAA